MSPKIQIRGPDEIFKVVEMILLMYFYKSFR